MSNALSNISISSASTGLSKYVTNQWLGIHARSCGFIQRRGNLNPVKFVSALITTVGTPQKRDTIQAMVTEYNCQATKGEQICYKPLHNRLRSEECVTFMATLVGRLQERVFTCSRRADADQLLERLQDNGIFIDDIYLHDGTYWKINENFAGKYPATRSAKKAELIEDTYEPDGSPAMKEAKFAQMGLQTTFSMKTGTITKICVTSATANETEYVRHGNGKRILHLMDAGYGSFSLLKQMDERGDHFITKLKSNSAAVIETATIDGSDFTDLFKGKKLTCKEFRTFRIKDHVDLTVNLSDGSHYRVIRFYSKKEHQARNFVTNLFAKEISPKTICSLYKISWQIELLFKELKSGSNLTGVNTRVENIMLVMLFASLAAHFLKQLVAGAVTTLNGCRSSLYRLSVYSSTWLRNYIKAVFSGDLQTIKQIIKKLADAKSCFEQVKQSHLKHEAMKTLTSVYCYLFKSLDTKGFKKTTIEA